MPSFARTALLLGAPLVSLFVFQSARAADPTTGDCLSGNESSIALRRDHKLRAAREQLLVCSSTSCPAEIRHACLRRVEEVNSAIPTVVFEAKDAAGNDVDPVKVMMDGQVIAQRLAGTSLSIDPGTHAFTFEAPGQSVVQKSFVILEGQKERRERIDFPASGPGSALSAPLASSRRSENQVDMPPPATTEHGHTQRVAGLIVAGSGVVLLGTSLVMTLVAKSHDDSAANESFPAKYDDSLSASHLANAASIVAGTGAVAAAVGAVLWLTAPRGQTAVGTNGSAVWLRGNF